ncbi:MAG: hypothetical protein V3V75_11490 [Thermoguttaceae bacterium]
MTRRSASHRVSRILTITLITVMAGTLLAGRPAVAGELKDLNTSLRQMPADAAFYCSMMRNREQIEAITNSRAWAKLMDMPAVKQAWAIYQIQAVNSDSVPGQIETALNDPQVQELLDTLADMCSEEMFLYGGKDFVGSINLLQEIMGAVRYGPIMLQATGQKGDLGDDEIMQMLLMATLSEDIDLLKMPEMIMGFKISDANRVKNQLAKLELIIGVGMTQVPELKGALKRETIDGNEYLTFSLNGGMVPLDEEIVDKLRELEAEPGDADKLIEKLKKATLKIALGIRGDYLLLSIGPSTDQLQSLGKGDLLIDRPELKPLAKFTDRRLTSIGYVGKDMMAVLGTNKHNIDDLLELVDTFLPLAELPDERAAQIKKDAAALAEDIKTLVPEPGAALAFSFLTERGVEGYTYNWTENLQLDGSKPLELLNHVGGNPLLAIVARGKYDPGQYDMLVKWIKVGCGYFEELGLPNIPKGDRKEVEEVLAKIKPLASRLDVVTRTMLIPALADGQVALVVDAKLTSKQFHTVMPPSEEPMPMIEPAIVIGVSDAGLLRKACGEYVVVIDGVLEVLGEIKDSELPEGLEVLGETEDSEGLKVPPPQVAETSAGTIFSYPLPAELGLDAKILPNAGLSESVAVLSISKEHTQRLLQSTPLKVGGLLAGSNRDLAMAVVFDWAGLVEAATPWVDMAVAMATAEASVGTDTSELVDQVQTVLEVLKVLRTITSETRVEGDVTVTHTLTEIRDIE